MFRLYARVYRGTAAYLTIISISRPTRFASAMLSPCKRGLAASKSTSPDSRAETRLEIELLLSSSPNLQHGRSSALFHTYKSTWTITSKPPQKPSLEKHSAATSNLLRNSSLACSRRLKGSKARRKAGVVEPNFA